MTTTKKRKKVLLILLSFSDVDENLSRNVPADLMGGITYPHLSHHWQKEWDHHDGLKQFLPKGDFFPFHRTFLMQYLCVYEGISGHLATGI